MKIAQFYTERRDTLRKRLLAAVALMLIFPGWLTGQSQPAAKAGADYVIGPGDVLSIVVWREKELSSDVVVRPDGKISLPLVNDVVASGLTPEQLRRRLTDAVKRFVLDDPVVTVVVKEIKANTVFITGQVLHPGPFTLTGPTTVLQVIAMAGGFTEFADRKKILVARIDNGVQTSFFFNYDDVARRGQLQQNIVLKAGDTIIVP